VSAAGPLFCAQNSLCLPFPLPRWALLRRWRERGTVVWTLDAIVELGGRHRELYRADVTGPLRPGPGAGRWRVSQLVKGRPIALSTRDRRVFTLLLLRDIMPVYAQTFPQSPHPEGCEGLSRRLDDDLPPRLEVTLGPRPDMREFIWEEDRTSLDYHRTAAQLSMYVALTWCIKSPMRDMAGVRSAGDTAFHLASVGIETGAAWRRHQARLRAWYLAEWQR